MHARCNRADSSSLEADWMTHPNNKPELLSQQQPLAQWIEQRQKAFADFSRSLQPPSLTSSNFQFGQDPADFWTSHQHNHQPLKRRTTMLANSETLASPKAKLTYDEGQFAVEIPLHEYRPEELSVKTEGDVLVILAKHETQTESGGSFISKQFEQRFSLPSGVKPDSIVSSLSKDGTLTVKAPRTPLSLTSTPIGGFKKSRGAIEEEIFNPQTTQSPQNQGLPHPKVTYDDDKFQISLDCNHFKPEELDVKVDGHTIIITAKQEIKEPGGTRTRVFEQKFTLPAGVLADRVTSTINAEGVLNIIAPKVGKPATINTIETKMDRILSPSSWTEKHGIQRPNLNFDHLDFSEAGASKAFIDGDMYKIEINVSSFKPEELMIKTVGQNVQVEAKHEEKTTDGASFTSRNFSQSFSLPKGVDPELVSSSLSKDGKLTIEAPMPKLTRMATNERLVPIKHN